MIDLYGSGSPNVVKVLFMLGETELPFEIQYVNVMAGENFDPVLVALNPNAKIPVIVDHDGPDGRPVSVFESGAILVYLAEKTGRFYGRNLAERAAILQWVMLQMSGIGPMFGQAVHFTGVAPQGNDYARTRYFTEAARLCGVLERRLSESRYLGGADFSIADMATFPWLWKYPKQLGIDLGGMPNLERWRAAMEARPGFERVRSTVRALVQRGLAEQGNADPAVLDRFYLRGRWAIKPQSARQ
jgi:GST-like protein